MYNDADNSLDSSNCESDLITIGAFTPYETGVWKFPNTQLCPLRSCALHFETRDLTIKHYKEEHAKHSALCKICNYPLMLLKGAHHFATHFQRKHPEHEVPRTVKSFQLQCAECNLSYKTFGTLLNHERIVHHKTRNIPMPSHIQVSQLNEEPLVVSSSTNVGRESSSWEDVDTEDSVSNDGSLYDPSSRTSSAKTKKTNKRKRMEGLRQLIRHKPGLFKPRPRAYTCTLCGFRGLKNYVMACNHYRKTHGRDVSMCRHCERFFTNSITYIHHMAKHHPRKSRGSYTSQTVVSKRRVTETPAIDTNVINDSKQNVAISNDENGIILIGEATDYPAKLFRFPEKLKKCPKSHCYQRFKDHESITNHYRIQHAKYDISCPECNTLITAKSHLLKLHFNRKHPNCDLPRKKSEVTNQATNAPESSLDNAVNINDPQVSNEQVSQLIGRKTIVIEKPINDHLIQNQHIHENPQPKEKASSKSLNPGVPVPVPAPVPSLQLIATVDLLQEDDESVMGHLVENTKTAPEKTSNKTKVTCSSPKISKPNEKPKQDAIPQASPSNKRRWRIRSPSTRHKACTICGVILPTFVDACDHYHRVHGRNVFICPYCEIYFIQSTLLRKHVLAEHSKGNVCVQMIARNCVSNSMSNNETHTEENNGQNNDTIPAKDELDDTIPEVVPSAQENADNFSSLNDEPLDLTVQKECEIIDLTNGVLDLSTKNKRK